MICTPCKEVRHDECEDRVRTRDFERWFKIETASLCDIHGIEAKHAAKLDALARLRPYKSCACHHRQSKPPPTPPEPVGPVFSAPIAP